MFQIGEAAKILGISRKMILNYEEHGLIVPAFKNEQSGYRYYTADNLAHLRSIRTLQSLGLSLLEIAEYYDDTRNIDHILKHLTDLRDTLDKNIHMLQIRTAKQGDLTVHPTILPRQVCFCRQYHCSGVAEATDNLRNTYIDAARTGLMSTNRRMFTVRQQGESNMHHLLCCIPMEESFAGAERREFPETPALCIYYRGSYEGTPAAFHTLRQYIQDNSIRITDDFRSIYLEGPPNHGKNSSKYITQIAVPVTGI